MEYAYATCILSETGEEINEENLTAVLEAAGCSVIESRVKAIVAALEDIDVSETTAVDPDGAGTEPPGDLETGDADDAVANGEELEEASEPAADEGSTAVEVASAVSPEQRGGDREPAVTEESVGAEPPEES